MASANLSSARTVFDGLEPRKSVVALDGHVENLVLGL
jgi:hypothetical protein